MYKIEVLSSVKSPLLEPGDDLWIWFYLLVWFLTLTLWSQQSLMSGSWNLILAMHIFLTVKHLQTSILNISHNQNYHFSSKKFLWMSSKHFVCISSLCFEVVLCLTKYRKFIWKEGCLPTHSFNIGNLLEEINDIPYSSEEGIWLYCLMLESWFHCITWYFVGQDSQLPLFKNAQCCMKCSQTQRTN